MAQSASHVLQIMVLGCSNNTWPEIFIRSIYGYHNGSVVGAKIPPLVRFLIASNHQLLFTTWDLSEVWRPTYVHFAKIIGAGCHFYQRGNMTSLVLQARTVFDSGKFALDYFNNL